MNQLFKKAAAFSLSIILFGTSAKAYNLSPISFANFYHIAEEGDLQGLKNVQRRGLNLNSTNQNGDTAVCVAIKRQDYLAYKTLIRAGAKSNPDCTKKIPEYAHKAFLSNYNQKYAAPQTPINWTKSGTALLVGAGVAAGTVALIGVGGGGGGSGGSSSDSGNTQDCSVNKCALGCFENKVCSENEVCDSYNTCGGCESCKVSSSCKQNSCNQGCYTNLTCQPGYTCSKRNKCGGCESCAELSECKKNVCAAGCYTNLTCADGYTCSQKNICGGCDRCTLIDPTNPDISNALHCKNYDRNKNLCLACHQYYKLEKGRCVDDIPENCEDYDSVSNKCTSCLEGYKISDDGRVCLVEQEDLECNATNYPLTTIPDKNTSYYDSCTDNNKTKRYRISGCKEGYQINSTKTACLSSGGSTGEETLTCNTTNYPLTRCPDNANECSSCTPTGSSTYIYRLKSCKTGFSISSDGKSCIQNSSTTCDSNNYPYTNSCPIGANCSSCTETNVTRYKITSCKENYKYDESNDRCIAQNCTKATYPLDKCPNHGTCVSCTSNETNLPIYALENCETGYSINTDHTECEEQKCDTTKFPLTSCPNGAECSNCYDSTGEHLAFKNCLPGYTKTGDNTCELSSTAPGSETNYDANDATISLTTKDEFSKATTYNGRIIGFTAKKNPTTSAGDTVTNLSTADIYNAKTKAAIISITNPYGENTKDIVGIANAGGTGKIFNSYGSKDKIGPTGKIYIESKAIDSPITTSIPGAVGIMGNSDVYNSYYGNGIIEINTISLFTLGPNNYLTSPGIYTTGNAFNAWGGTGLIKTTGTGIRAKTTINAAAGGTGTIEINATSSYGEGIDSVDGFYNSSLAYNALSTDKSKTTGNINITAQGGNGIRTTTAYNAYGEGAEGNINFIIKANPDNETPIYYVAGMKLLYGSNGENGGVGTITIKDENASTLRVENIIGIDGTGVQGQYKNKTAFNGGANGKGTIIISSNSKENSSYYCSDNNCEDAPSIIGIKEVTNGNLVNGIGTIQITDTGGNSIYGIYNGNQYNKLSSITINSVAGKKQAIIGIQNNTSKFSYLINEGNITLSNSGLAYVIGTMLADSENSVIAHNTGNINIKGKGDLYGMVGASNNQGSIILDDESAQKTGMYLGSMPFHFTSTGSNFNKLTNNGSITIEKANGYAYGMHSNVNYWQKNNLSVINNGNITINSSASSGSLYGIKISGSVPSSTTDLVVTNNGTITINNITSGMTAYGINLYDNATAFETITGSNNGKIVMNVAGGTAYGLYSSQGLASMNNEKSGNIDITGFGTIYGAYGNSHNTYTAEKFTANNMGTINITTNGESTVYGIIGQSNGGSVIINDEHNSTIIGTDGYNTESGGGGKNYSSGLIKITTNTNKKVIGSLVEIDGTIKIYSTGTGYIYGTDCSHRSWKTSSNNDGNLTINSPNSAEIYGIHSNTGATFNGNMNLTGKNIFGLFHESTDNQYYNISNTIDDRGAVEKRAGSINITTSKGKNYGIFGKNVKNITNGNVYGFKNDAASISIKTADNVKNTDNVEIYGIYGENVTGYVTNTKPSTISISGTASTAYGIYASADPSTSIDGVNKSIINHGNINITLNSGTAYGIWGSGMQIKNTGNITLTGVDIGTSKGIYAVASSKVYNSGTITINGETYNKNEADGKFIYVDSTSSVVNEGDIVINSPFSTMSMGGGKFVLAKNGKIIAPEIKGEITADANITSGGFDKTYSSENAVSGKNDEVKLNSGSALFDAVLKNNDIVMTMKDFDKVVDDKSLAAYLQHNYNAKRNDGLFNQLKTYDTAQNLNSALNQNLGFSLLPNFAQENMNVFRSLSNLVTDTMFSQDLTNERMMVGYDYLGQDRSSKGRVTGYENTANSSYFLADTKLNNRQRFGLGVALTRFNSDYDDDSTRKATFAQALASYMHNFGNHWQYAGVARLGYADGDYKRKAGSTRIEGDTSDILYGLNNELRYNYDLGFMTLEPQVELNAYGYYQRKIKEDNNKTDALLVDGTNNLSVEAGTGLYASKETVYGENGRIKARLGGSYYRELSQPYHSMHARVRDTDGYYLIESTDIFDRNRMVVRADITFSWKALDFYLRGSQFMEDKHTTVINAGVKYNF